MSLLRMTPDEIDALVGANLRRLREEACLAVPPAAARLRIDPERLAAAEAGAAHLTCPEMLVAMRVFGCGFDAFFSPPPPKRMHA